MSTFSTPSILLRRTAYGDNDWIITFITLEKGKVTVIAKHARKSRKRFAGVLELFSALQMVCTTGRGKGLPVLQEAVLDAPFPEIRTDIRKMAYASYWAELLNLWLEEGQCQQSLYYLFRQVLTALNDSTHHGELPPEALSLFFQMKFMRMSGYLPNLRQCATCRIGADSMNQNPVMVDLVKGGLVCERCASDSSKCLKLSKGTIKQLLWLADSDFEKARRMRFSATALKEGLMFMDAFVPFHLGMEPRSLKFLRKIIS